MINGNIRLELDFQLSEDVKPSAGKSISKVPLLASHQQLNILLLAAYEHQPENVKNEVDTIFFSTMNDKQLWC